MEQIPPDRQIGYTMSKEMSKEGMYVVCEGEERYYPMHEDPGER